MAKETKANILQAASQLFGEYGFDNVSVRDITNRADVNLSALSYHFVDKNGVISAVLTQCSERINSTRSKLLDRALKDHDNHPPLRAIIEAFVAPIFIPEIHQTDPRLISSLISKTLIHSDENNPFNVTIFRETVDRYLKVLNTILPAVSEKKARSILRLCSGAAVSYRAFSYDKDGKVPLEATAQQHTAQLKFILDFLDAGVRTVIDGNHLQQA